MSLYYLLNLFQWRKELKEARKKQLERGRQIRRSPRAQDVKRFYKESSSEEEKKKQKPKLKVKSPKPKAKKVTMSLET